MNRVAKQVIIASIFFGIIFLILWPFYRAGHPAATCSDGLQNGSEEGVDCGAVCELSCPEVRQEAFLEGVVLVENADQSTDGVITITNPNATHGAVRLVVEVEALNTQGAIVNKRRQITYANPLANQVIVIPFESSLNVASVSARIVEGDSTWSRISASTPERVSLVIKNEVLSRADLSSQFSGVIENQSPFDVAHVDVAIVLYDKSGAARAAASTSMSSLGSGQERAFVIRWPFVVPEGLVARVALRTNLLQDGNLENTHGADERFQQY
jgi:hypothetical protein